MKRSIWLLVGLLISIRIVGQEHIYICKSDHTVETYRIDSVQELNFSAGGLLLNVRCTDGTTATCGVQEIDSIVLVNPADVSSTEAPVRIAYNGTTVTVVNPYATRGVMVAVEGADVVVQSSLNAEVTYLLSGTTPSGSFKLYSSKKSVLLLNGVNLTSQTGPAINIQSGKKTTVQLAAGTTNTLTDATTYLSVDGEDQKGCFFSEGQLAFEGEGSLTLVGNYAHALCSDDYICQTGGKLSITRAVKDGIHVNDYFRLDGGALVIAGCGGDAIDGGEGYVMLNGGALNVTAGTADTKGVKCDSLLQVNGGTHTFSLSGAQTKGLKSAQAIEINGGELHFTATGNAVVSNYEPSYCTAIKSDGSFVMTGGTVTLTHSGTGGKGISADGNITLQGGVLDLTTTGAGATYATSSGTDAYAACCIKADGALAIYGGEQTLKSTGTGGKCISGEQTLVIGKLNDSTACPLLSATTTGSRLGTSSEGGGGGRPGGGGGGWPGGGGGTTTTSASKSSKAIKADGSITIYNGVIEVNTATDGAEGIESKTSYTQYGGDVICNTYDDCINSSGKIIFNGGRTYCYAIHNDAIDSNGNVTGAITINGGIVLAVSACGAPEEGIDCDNAALVVTGGYLFTMGAAQSSTPSVPTASTATQPTCLLTSMSLTKGQYFTVADNSGNNLFTFLIPCSLSGDYSVVSAPGFAKGSTYTFKTGTVAPTDATSVFHGFYLGSSCKGTTAKKTITFSSNYVKG